jgi:phosphate transport system permease protein
MLKIKSLSSSRKKSIRKFLQTILHHGDRPWNVLLIAMSVVSLILMLSIGWLLWTQSAKARTEFGWSFLTPTVQGSWDPVKEVFTAWQFIYGTLITSILAILLALPSSIGIAIFLAELCPVWLRTPLGVLIELLAAIPSVVFGLWGLFVFLPTIVTPIGTFLSATLGSVPFLSYLFTGPIPVSGASRLAASLILTIMIIPTITSVTRDVFLTIPHSQREASFALGATQWETIRRVLIPYGISGILGAVILGLGRALGETMAVTMVIGNSIEGSLSLLRPGYTMSSIIANEFVETVSPLHSEALVEIALLLFVLTLLLNLAARFLVWRVTRMGSQEVRA